MSTRVAVRNIGQVRVTTDQLDPVDGQPVQVKFAEISVAAGATETLVAAVTGKKIRVLKVWGQGGGAGATITFKSAATAITGAIPISVTAGEPVDMESQFGLFETVASALLACTTSGGDTFDGYLVYCEV